MARPNVSLRDQERPFDFDELFFSTTDRKSVIRSGNAVFSRVAGYDSLSEMIGEPHNLIRHPDMPRSVFKIMWDIIKSGEPFAGYVKNLATDGCYYWVMALVVPTSDGYLSVRFKPSSPFFGMIRQVYHELLEVERTAHTSGETNVSGMEKACVRLNAILAEKGYENYIEFMRAALPTEMESRFQKVMPATRLDAPIIENKRGQELGRILHACRMLEKQLHDLFNHAASFLQLVERFDKKAASLRDLAHQFHFVSLNGVVSSSHLDRSGAALSVVTQSLATIAQESKTNIDEMLSQRSVTSLFRATSFAITSAKLQVEMTSFFARELLQHMANKMAVSSGESVAEYTDQDERAQRDIEILIHSFVQSIGRMLESLPMAQESIDFRIRLNERLTAILERLAMARVAGKVQATHARGAQEFQEFFEEVNEKLRSAKRELLALDSDIPHLQAHMPRFRDDGNAVQKSLNMFY